MHARERSLLELNGDLPNGPVRFKRSPYTKICIGLSNLKVNSEPRRLHDRTRRHESISLYRKHQKPLKSIKSRASVTEYSSTLTYHCHDNRRAQFPDVSGSVIHPRSTDLRRSDPFDYLSDIEVYHNVRILEYGTNINCPLRWHGAKLPLSPTSERNFEACSFLVRSSQIILRVSSALFAFYLRYVTQDIIASFIVVITTSNWKVKEKQQSEKSEA